MESTIRYKLARGKKRPLWGHHGNCENLAFKEVYPNIEKKNRNWGWCYLCKKHFK
ncbi:MAG: hypothetical protein WD876_03990 [Candidatus Pacearchaeota archaeon]